MRIVLKKMTMLNGIVLCAFVLLATSNSIGQTLENDNQRTSVYLHPISLITGIASLASESFHATFLDLTGEFPLSERYAFIVKPHMLFISGSGETGQEECH